MELLAVVFFGVSLAYANGANDNFKGVATLFGSGTTDYRVALRWATAMTFVGSLVMGAIFVAVDSDRTLCSRTGISPLELQKLLLGIHVPAPLRSLLESASAAVGAGAP